MRLWSLHPKYLDAKGLVALWREGLLALHVLQGNTKGYINHPQLARFKAHADPIQAMHNYLHAVVDEADARDYHFDRGKLAPVQSIALIPVTQGQVAFETGHLQHKLQLRDKKRYEANNLTALLQIHPSFRMVEGEVESWERVNS
jgi:hypothetical protein